MTKDAKLEGSSQQANKDAINRRNGQGPIHLKLFLLVFLIRRPKSKKAQAQTEAQAQHMILSSIIDVNVTTRTHDS